MATRLYLEYGTTAPVTPSAWNANWETAGSLTYGFSTTKQNTTMTSIAHDNTPASGQRGAVRWVSPPIQATTLTGTFRMVVRCAGVQAGSYFKSNCVLSVVSNDGTTVRGVVVLQMGLGDSIKWSVSSALKNATLPEAWEATVACTSTAITENDRLVLEFGASNQNLGTDDGIISLGSDSATDCAFNETATAANNPWMELSQNLVFNSEGGGGGSTNTNQLMMTGCGT